MGKYKNKSFREFLEEETVSGDIATVDTPLVRRNKHLSKGKKCKKHKKMNCITCEEEKYDNYQ